MRQSAIGNSARYLAIGAAVLLFLLMMVPSAAFAAQGSYSVKVDTGYLALRTAPAYDSSNEIGELYTGDVVDVQDMSSNSQYWWVYSSKLNKSGWVNKDYLVNRGSSYSPQGSKYYAQGSKYSSQGSNYRVQVEKNYLALRTAPAYERSNEIGELYTGDTVRLINAGSGQYWWVYSPKYDREGYVNKDYLRSMYASTDDCTVRVNTGYLALRTRPAYDSSNEIGELYTGDTVTVKDRSNGQYWWVYSPKHAREGYVNKDYLV